MHAVVGGDRDARAERVGAADLEAVVLHVDARYHKRRLRRHDPQLVILAPQVELVASGVQLQDRPRLRRGRRRGR